MDKITRAAIEKATQRARKLLEADFAEQLEGTYDVLPSGHVAPAGGSHLTPRKRPLRELDKLLETLNEPVLAGVLHEDETIGWSSSSAPSTCAVTCVHGTCLTSGEAVT